MPDVTLIIPCYNSEHCLGATLASVQAQTCPDWEAIVVDDRSEDGSVAIAEAYADKDRRFQVVSRQGNRKGANVCRNQGLGMANGQYVVFLDSDDLLLETCLEQRVAAMKAAPRCDFGVYQTELFAENVGDRRVLWNIYTATPDLYRFVSKDLVWHTTGPIWRKEALTRLGGFDEGLLSFHDWEIHTRALISGMEYFKVRTRDHFYRNGSNSPTAISTVSCTRPDHLRSHEKMFEKTLWQLRSAGLLNPEIRSRVTGLFWWLATRWRAIGRVSEGDGVWRKARELGLCGRGHYFEGRLILRLCGLRGGGRVSALIQRTWPPQFYRTGSDYFLRAPIGDAPLVVSGSEIA